MKAYTTDQLRRFTSTINDNMSCPQKYVEKYHVQTIPPNVSGKAWVMWFLDMVDNAKEDLFKIKA